MITKEQKAETIQKYGASANDSGSVDVQVALLTNRITDLTHHLEVHKQDNHSRRGLIKLVAKRKRILDYVAHTDIQRYRAILQKLSLRK